MSDTELDSMSSEDCEAYSNQLWPSHSPDQIKAFALRDSDSSIPIVAVGDSWFDYQPVGLDILDFLQKMPDYDILDHGVAGDTIENMVYGTEYKRRGYRPVRPRLEAALEDLENSGAKFFLISGGGNDVAGKTLENLLNHADTGLPHLRADHVDFLVDTVFRQAFEHMFKRIWSIDPSVQIIGHGYGNAVPDGRAVIRIGPFEWVGPWLRPALTKKRILSAAERQTVITTLIARLNNLLIELDQTYPNYHALDARTVIADSDWENELHLKNSAFRRVARLFDTKIKSLRGLGSAGA